MCAGGGPDRWGWAADGRRQGRGSRGGAAGARQDAGSAFAATLALLAVLRILRGVVNCTRLLAKLQAAATCGIPYLPTAP